MFERAKTYLLYGNRFCGIELTNTNGREVFIGSILKKTKNQIDIQESFEASTNEELASKLPKKIAVFLSLNTDKILTKRLENDSSEPIRLVHKAFPNIDIKEFYYEVLVQDSTHFVSICRKDYVAKILEKLQKANVSIINLSLGSLIISSVLEYVNADSIFTYNKEILYSGNILQEIKDNTTKEELLYNISGINATNSNILSLTGALNLVVGRNISISNFESEKFTLLSDYKQSRFFGSFLKTGLIFIFGLLLVNFLVFNYYFEKVQSLEQNSQVNQDTKSQVLELNKKVETSQKMVEDILKSAASRSSFYTNEIILSLPETIVLGQFDYQPLQKRIKADQPISNEKNVISISGESSNRELFSDWISVLEQKTWIERVEISDYNDISNSISSFDVKISLLDD